MATISVFPEDPWKSIYDHPVSHHLHSAPAAPSFPLLVRGPGSYLWPFPSVPSLSLTLSFCSLVLCISLQIMPSPFLACHLQPPLSLVVISTLQALFHLFKSKMASRACFPNPWLAPHVNQEKPHNLQSDLQTCKSLLLLPWPKALWWLSSDFRTTSILLNFTYKIYIHSGNKHVLNVYLVSSTGVEVRLRQWAKGSNSVPMEYLFWWEANSKQKLSYWLIMGVLERNRTGRAD